MHKYIKKQAKLHQPPQTQTLSPTNSLIQPSKTIQHICQRGQPLSQQTVTHLLQQSHSTQQKQNIIYQLLMYRKVKMLEKFFTQKKINKAEMIDSSGEIKKLYEGLVWDGRGERKGKSKEEDRKDEEDKEMVVGEMSKKDKLLNVIKRKTKFLKTINPKYYALVVGLIIVAVLVKNYRAKIVSVLKLILNV